MSGDIDTIKQDVSGMSGDISRIRGTDYESHVATYVHRFLRRNLGINATVLSTQRDKSALTGLLDEAETQGNIQAQETDELDKADLVLTADGPTDYLLAEVSIHRPAGRHRPSGRTGQAAGQGHSTNRHPLRHRGAGPAGPPKGPCPGHPRSGAPDSLNHGVPQTARARRVPTAPSPNGSRQRGLTFPKNGHPCADHYKNG